MGLNASTSETHKREYLNEKWGGGTSFGRSLAQSEQPLRSQIAQTITLAPMRKRNRSPTHSSTKKIETAPAAAHRACQATRNISVPVAILSKSCPSHDALSHWKIC